VLIARFLPVGNFTLINVFLGSLKVPYLAFLAGNTVGMAPSLLGLTLFSEQLHEAIHEPSVTSIGRLVLIVALALGLLLALSRFFAKRRAQRAQAEGSVAP
jgi:phospholipase D1/2